MLSCLVYSPRHSHVWNRCPPCALSHLPLSSHLSSISLSPRSFCVNFTVEHWATGNVHVEAHSLPVSRPCLICFDARARTESSSSITFIMTSVIIEVCGKESSACTSYSCIYKRV